MINRTVLVGRLTKDPEIRYTQSGMAVANFTMAVNRQFTNANGEREADFISCIVWRKAAENFCNFTHKGSLVGIDGRIQTSSYEKEGQRVYATQVVVDSFSLLEPKQQSQQRGQQSNASDALHNNFGQPTNNYSQNNNDFGIDDNDLPF
ncbi:single-stranded DNA-binding protein [Pediococcus acidilactici]|jgi:single-strand DNA-binding protein|uniref:single-stranded DNA-binding protein n=1 Tax=Pediococcus acidilactici TaxID=1254 RepID=UPI0007EFDA07|nr:single-stranded DNA-binding protein [Pediococcus acidilactici]ARW24285.1 Single-stranded DNA-binding protein [Pediococcus acidilactici]ARW26319.1 Single-stranded DNA-binding protein [Pediococcus acidilactici]ARW28403.1 Single-stranded DNA-binding protein [Pediococcus acidilactici]KAF0517142.1 single-stranded DNA-binding protein [Pediococcus acidilactici]MCT3036372.1 single-stranded DNA-binding protein [Pediococcus acidilactici]